MRATVGGRAAPPAAQRGRSAEAAAGGSPHAITWGESDQSQRLAIIDWLRFTFLPSCEMSHALEYLTKHLATWFTLPLNFVPAQKGIFSYKCSYDVMVWMDAKLIRVAVIGLGDEAAGNTVMVDLSGTGCAMVSDWHAVHATMQDLDARITRVDTALDLMSGYNLEYFDDLYLDGQFNCGGRIPSRRYIESGNCNDVKATGRTLYLGKKVNGKELCIYEKGKEQGRADSEWIRVEVRFGSRDRVIPHDVVLQPTVYFCGAFVALRDLVDSDFEKIATDRREVVEQEYDIAMAHLTHYLKASYGHVLHLMRQDFKDDLIAMVDSIAVPGVPRRMHKAVLARHATMQASDVEQPLAA